LDTDFFVTCIRRRQFKGIVFFVLGVNHEIQGRDFNT